jgi:uncharacterized protein (TIGR00730 family)
MKITVFGGSQAQAGSIAYAEAEALGASLAQLGHTVLTGGYSGTMEAVSRGASFAGGHVIGVTCAELERSHNTRTNAWVAEEWKKETLIERLRALIESCDAALALPGGPGTLTEIALTWNLMIVGGIEIKPLVLIGPGWRVVFDEFVSSLGEYIPQSQRDLVAFSPDGPSVIRFLNDLKANPRAG